MHDDGVLRDANNGFVCILHSELDLSLKQFTNQLRAFYQKSMKKQNDKSTCMYLFSRSFHSAREGSSSEGKILEKKRFRR